MIQHDTNLQNPICPTRESGIQHSNSQMYNYKKHAGRLHKGCKKHEETAKTTEGDGGDAVGGSGVGGNTGGAGVGAGGRIGRGTRATGAGRGGRRRAGGGIDGGLHLELDTGNLLTGVVVDLLGDGGARDGDQLSGGGVRQTVLDVVGDLGGNLGQIPGVVEGLAGDERGITGLGLDVGLGRVAGGDAVKVELVDLVLEVVEVDEGGDGVGVVDLDETVVVVLLGPLVDETTGEGLGHLDAVDGLHLGEGTGLDLVAAVLGEEDGDGGIGEVFSQDIISAGLVRGVAAPGVRVETEEVSTGRGGVLEVTLEVVDGVHENVTDVSGGVTDRNGTLGVLGDVVLHVTDDGTNVLGGGVSSFLVDNLVSSKETEEVVVVLEALNDTKDLLVVDGTVGGPRGAAVEVATLQRVADIEDHVDTGSVEDGSTLVVVERGLQVVNTDGVDLIWDKFLSERVYLRLKPTPRRCMRAASRRQTSASLRGSFLDVKPDDPPGW